MNPTTCNAVQFWEAVINIIIEDLKFHRHANLLSNKNVEYPPLETRICESVFVIMGFKKMQISRELADWYYGKADQAINVKVDDEIKLWLIAVEIFYGLEAQRRGASPKTIVLSLE